MADLTNCEREKIALSAIKLMQEMDWTVSKIAEHFEALPDDDDIRLLIRKRQPDSLLHLLKCCVAAGVVNSSELSRPWPSLQKKPCYRIPQSWYEASYHPNSNISHGHLTDYTGRTLPNYLTERSLDIYLSVDNDDRRRLIATILLVSSRQQRPIASIEEIMGQFIQENLQHYKQLPKKEKVRQPFVSSQIERMLGKTV